MFRGKGYNQTTVGETFETSLTVTETHLVLGSGLFGDFNPLHVNETFAKQSRFGGRILHGPFTSALVAAPVGNFFHSTAIAYLEHACKFVAPVRIGDTLTTCWTITERIDKPKQNGGIAVLSGRCTNQHDIVVVTANGKILVANA
ncbi:MAG: acyl dehydratase [Betaproteobacteria bacterium]|nr:acyl dehydratase [Betaproteobacteria bacterium]